MYSTATYSTTWTKWSK